MSSPAARAEVIRATGHRTVPVILIDEVLIGGSDDLATWDRSGRLTQILST